jgi:hypothetical protein
MTLSMARRLRADTRMSLAWIADRLRAAGGAASPTCCEQQKVQILRTERIASPGSETESRERNEGIGPASKEEFGGQGRAQ